MDLKELKSYMKIDFDTDDALILSLVAISESYLKNAGVTQGYDDPRYKLVIMSMTLNLYENRPIVSDGSNMINRFILQLKYSGGDGLSTLES